jgi:hypothetical protein
MIQMSGFGNTAPCEVMSEKTTVTSAVAIG